MTEDTNEYFVGKSDMTTDDIAALLVKLYGEYVNKCGGFGESKNNNFARAVGMAIRMLTD